MAMLQLEKELEKLTKSARLSDALGDVDRLIDMLTEARQKVAEGCFFYLGTTRSPQPVTDLRSQQTTPTQPS